MSACTEIRELLPMHAADCLEADEAVAVEKHLATCDPCAKDAQTRAAALATLREPLDEKEPELDRHFAAIWQKAQEKLAPEAIPAPEPSTALSIALVCSFCKDVLARAEACYCASCLAPHHEECFRAHGRCSAYGCEETSIVRPNAQSVARPIKKARPLGPAIALAAGGLMMGAAALQGISAWRSKTAEPEPVASSAASSAPIPTPIASVSEVTAPIAVVSIEAKDEPLEDVVAGISSKSNASVGIVVSPDVHAKVTLSLHEVPWPTALDLVASSVNAQVLKMRDGTLVVDQPPLVTIQFTDANVRTVLQLLAAYSGKNIVISPDVHGDLTLDLHRVYWLDALKTIAHTVGDYAVLRRGDVIVVKPRASVMESEREDVDLADWPAPFDPLHGLPVDIDATNELLSDAIAPIASKSGRTFDVAPELSQSRVTIHAHGTSWRDALAMLGRSAGFRVHEDGTRMALEPRPVNTIQLTDANVRVVLQVLASYLGKPIVISPEVRGDVTVDIHAVFYDEALVNIVRNVGDYEVVEESSGILRVVPRSTIAAEKARDQAKVSDREGTSKRKRTPVIFANGRVVQIGIEGLFLGPKGPEASRALLEGRVYEVGDVVTDRDGKKLDVKVIGIREGELELEDTTDGHRMTVHIDSKRMSKQ